MHLLPRRAAPGAAAFLAALVVACCAWVLAAFPVAQPRFGDRGDGPAWRTEAPVQHLRPQAQTLVARQPSLPATVVPGSSGPFALRAEAPALLPLVGGDTLLAFVAPSAATGEPDTAWPRGPPVLVTIA